MNELSGFLLSLHGAAREVPFDAFQEHALKLLKALVPFDAARWGTARHDARGAAYHEPYLYNDSPESLKDYEAVREHDCAAAWCLEHLGTVANLPLSVVYAHERSPGLLKYVHRYRHMHGLIIGCKSGEDGLRQAISLYGAYDDKPFDESQRRTLELVFPHLMEALQTSLVLQMERIRPHRGDAAWSMAICDAGGDFLFVEPDFRDLLREEWPSLAHRALPAILTRLAATSGQSSFHGRAALFFTEVVRDAVFVRARARVPVDALSPRELEVAKLVTTGLTHKEIARSLAIAPATVRNHLQAIHERAGVHSNAELVQQLRRAGH
ncbi:helix-turn-helix transcriptional regulator [Paraburkholderia oxyphila]|uniref:helix-turn-helix transcriptional regulator n=1 Tax=Paraburkholderia oxyphila TaxID=614212 RepID=UPI000483E3FA|nr:helix-turn-helix transcriptional regulator [Paraburkholderia oxyphila]